MKYGVQLPIVRLLHRRDARPRDAPQDRPRQQEIGRGEKRLCSEEDEEKEGIVYSRY